MYQFTPTSELNPTLRGFSLLKLDTALILLKSITKTACAKHLGKKVEIYHHDKYNKYD